MIRAVLDTNVVLSALLFRGRANLLHTAWQKRSFVWLSSPEIIQEYARALAYPKFHQNKRFDVTQLLREHVLPYITPVQVAALPEIIVKDDPEDDKFIACAISGQAQYIVTGDNALLRIKKHQSVKCLSLHDFLQKIDIHES